jgi:hypothetical protein
MGETTGTWDDLYGDMGKAEHFIYAIGMSRLWVGPRTRLATESNTGNRCCCVFKALAWSGVCVKKACNQ